MTEPPPWPAELDAALQTAKEPELLEAERKAALWRQIEETTAAAHDDPARPHTRWVVWVGAAVALAAALVLWLGMRRTPSSGAHEARERVSVDLDGRGIAVAEAGATLRWQVDADGRAHVVQSEGLIFYRVEPGGAFTVSTPVGQVDVTGTSFEVQMKKKMIGSAALGGAVAAAMVVAVYEGNVVASNAHGEVAVAAGERVELVADRAPEPGSSRFAAAAVRDEAASPSPLSTQQLSNRVRELEAQLAEARADTRDSDRRRDDDEDDDRDTTQAYLFEPTQAMLEKAAKECRVAVAAPAPSATGDIPQVTEETVARVGLSAKERAAIDAVAVELNDGIIETARALYIEATGDEEGAADLSYYAMRSEIFDKSSKRDALEARTQISRERAGLAEPAADPSTEPLTTRLTRAEVVRGADFSRRLSEVLGVDRAREVRAKLPLAVHQTMGCEDDE